MAVSREEARMKFFDFLKRSNASITEETATYNSIYSTKIEFDSSFYQIVDNFKDILDEVAGREDVGRCGGYEINWLEDEGGG